MMRSVIEPQNVYFNTPCQHFPDGLSDKNMKLRPSKKIIAVISRSNCDEVFLITDAYQRVGKFILVFHVQQACQTASTKDRLKKS
jgi:hypothetical protein